MCSVKCHPYTQQNMTLLVDIPPPRMPSCRVLASSARGPRFNPESRTVSYQRRYKNGTSSALVQQSTLKREILALYEEKRQDKNVMDKIWDRNLSKSEVIGCCGGHELIQFIQHVKACYSEAVLRKTVIVSVLILVTCSTALEIRAR